MMSLGVADTNSTTYKISNRQGPAGQHGEVCSILCDNLTVTRGKDGRRDSQGV